ncbi:DNA-methyltransferase [Chryseobacterium sp. R2A-55]|uniref:DNA-methyltransferase n=1 Tax=Chryseobacterium sp. R2A-55 TaxID=2744445 RepID=UPI001F44F5BB|nr:site-specific DNA-methyltransferase [Chryseobacterium sp. R2A-55]
MTENIHLHHADNLEIMATLPDESIDIICIDPPYLYLKNQKLERVFDEPKFFSECKRLLTKKGFVIMFGRGESFYRWNTILADLGFIFKEEIIWNKSHCTSPLMRLSRVHETISIFTKGKGTINKVKVPYLEMKGNDIDSIIGDIKRMRSIFKNQKSLKAVEDFLENNTRDKSDSWNKNLLSISSDITKEDRCVSVARSFKEVLNEKSIIRTDRTDCETFTKFEVNADKRKTGDRCVNVMQSVEFGLNEKTIIKQVRDHYTAIHPTQKPVRLLERLLNLTIPKDKKEITVADFFAGSMSTMEAVLNLQEQHPDIVFNGIATEIDEEYFEAGKERILVKK